MADKDVLIVLGVITIISFILGVATMSTSIWMGLGWFAIAGGTFYARRDVVQNMKNEDRKTK